MKKVTKMKAGILLIASMLTTFAIGGCSSSKGEEPESKGEPLEVKEVPVAKGITDMVLLYHTDKSRPKWTKEEIAPYIYREGENGKPDWMFDGILFVEFILTEGDIVYTFDLDAYGRKYAPKVIWKRLVDKTFTGGVGPDAVETVLSELAEQGHTPPYKRQIVFGLPNPAYGVTDWGQIDGAKMDFNIQEHRLKALNWYIDLVIEEWKKKDYKYLNLAGFYWTKEFVVAEPDEEGKMLNMVKERLKSEGYEFSWIPYYGAEGADKWDKYGFDIAYQQPNHFFDTETPDWFLPESIKYAKKHGLKMEMEFDERVAQPEFAERFYKYIDQFELANIWEEMPVAHYQGNRAWLDLALSKDEAMIAMHKRLGDILSKRHGRFSQIVNK